MIKGTLYGVGVGPGDPRLMTYRQLTRFEVPGDCGTGGWKGKCSFL